MVEGGVFAVSRDRRSDMLDRAIGSAALMFDQPEQMKRLRVAGVDRQDLAADALRISSAACTLMGERRVEPLGDRRRSAADHSTVTKPGFSAPLLSVHWALIAHPHDTIHSGGK